MGFRKSTRDAKAQSAAEEHTNEARGGGGGPGVRRPGVGLGQLCLMRFVNPFFISGENGHLIFS